MLEDLQERLRNGRRRRRAYLTGARDEIRVENAHVACNACLFTIFILIGCVLVAPLFIKGWRPTPVHVAFLPTMAVLALASHLYRARSKTKRLATALCIAVGCVIVAFGILIDSLSSPMAPSVFTPMMIVALAALYIIPLWASAVLACALCVAYGTCAVAFKDPFVAQYDMLSALVALVFAVCVAYIIMRYRLEIYEAKSHYQHLSMRDDLSKVFNRRALFALTKDYFASAGTHAPCTLVFVDVDDLKSINDDRGHLAGDTVLRIVGELLQASFRATDVIGRFGGDEFVVFAPGPVNERALHEKAEQIRRQLAERTQAELGFAATVSLGAVIAEAGLPEVTDLIRRADDALYLSKRGGKNRLTVQRLDFGASR